LLLAVVTLLTTVHPHVHSDKLFNVLVAVPDEDVCINSQTLSIMNIF